MSINKSLKSNSNHKTFGITTFHSVTIEKPLNDDDVFSMFNIYFMFASNEYSKLQITIILTPKCNNSNPTLCFVPHLVLHWALTT